jgi:hypothetical protein
VAEIADFDLGRQARQQPQRRLAEGEDAIARESQVEPDHLASSTQSLFQ